MGKEKCKCCRGKGVQQNRKTGLYVVCSCCLGSGEWDVEQVKWRVSTGD